MTDAAPSSPDGKMVVLVVDTLNGPVRITASSDMLDDELGADADTQTRLDWVRDHMPGMMSALTARTEGGFVKKPYNRLLVEELT